MAQFKLRDMFKKPKHTGLNNGSILKIFGHDTTLHLVKTEASEKVDLAFGILRVSAKRLHVSHIRALLDQWYRRYAKQYLKERLDLHSQKLSISYQKVFIRGPRRRWGSASSLRNISLNWRLIQLPKEYIDYVIVHELTHLLEMNHSKKFWLLMDTHFPRHKEMRKKLREYEKSIIFS